MTLRIGLARSCTPCPTGSDTRRAAVALGLLLSVPLLVGLAQAAISAEPAEPVGSADPVGPTEPVGPAGPQRVAQRIDTLLAGHWQSLQVEPSAECDDATFLRRVTLDLAGRIPTTGELQRFLGDKAGDKRRTRIRQLLDGPEFALHFGSVLDQWIQGRFQGDPDFVDYLRSGLRQRKPWDTTFREIMQGPWDDKAIKPANRFLDKRAKDLDAMTSDTTRVFFGVDISCAKCHDHPLVDDWTQHHFYGMASFFNRTTGGKGTVGEKKEGEVKFVAQNGEEQTARTMFLSGQRIDDVAKSDGGEPISRREQLVRVALEERRFFSRSFVNRVWRQLMGRGLVEPVDQMHSGNEAAVPELLDWLAEDFATSGYDVPRLVAGIVLSRGYQLSSRWTADTPLPAPTSFAVARLRPLSRRQLATSILLAVGDTSFDSASSPQRLRAERLLGVEGIDRVERRLELEQRAAGLLTWLDGDSPDFQSSATEALFVSNAESIQQWIRGGEGDLAQRLAAMTDDQQMVEQALRTILARSPSDQNELQELAEWIGGQETDRRATCQQLVWALIASAEFRFNH
jgi:hypothetical protein